ncbi:MAG: hypothetical protein AVDCRST_MAG85-2677 [uncultured Solirubrobacteraceae bacterium]|uniref:Uncharacterized protein n=1 Tax=uncultured Solirubrobacteraceae bacterium TaxID=1162706 RepID=A0A6J4T8Q7_9ACTN|nr:MAG: hypothetical protein AVDCRST_MAG85-2677 [uncultured Solirubrobacteraceae bacterium]
MRFPRPCVVLLSCLLVLGAAAPASAAGAKRACSSSASNRVPVAGSAVAITGTLSSSVRRKVRLERRVGRRWVAVKTVTSSRRGAFRFAAPTAKPGSVVLRVVAPARGRRRKLTCASVNLTIRPAGPETAPGASAPAPAPPGPSAPPAPADPAPPAPPKPGPGDSFRAIYGVAADQAVDPNHVAAIRHEIGQVNGWYAKQTVGSVQPRWMRTNGVVDVEIVRLGKTAAIYGAGDFATARADLIAASPPAAPTQGTVLYMDVMIAQQACGIASADPPFVYIPEARCNNHPTTTSTFPSGGSYLLAHEMTHAFGALNSCSGRGSGHVTNNDDDVIWSGPGFLDFSNITLDPGRDDYYNSGLCGDIINSRYWTKTSDPAS